jgi:hypothetical protein
MKKLINKISDWEKWPFALLYFPLSFIWFWYCLKSRSLWFFSSSNPTITFGGFEGESKKEMYDQLPQSSYPKSIYILHDLSFDEVKKRMSDHGFTYPFVVKPDVGMQGILFRKIEDEEQMIKYHERIPVQYIIQEMVDLPVEVSVFYFRYPTDTSGTISGFIQKELLEVSGDGKRTLHELILEHPRAKLRMEEMIERHEHRLDRIIDEGQIFILSYAGNHNRGARFINLIDQADEQMLKVFDELSLYTEKFYYGRYDIKCSSIEDLKKGVNYSILEFNGCGAEPNHIYDAGISLFSAYKEILKHWKVLYEISRYNHLNGSPYWSFTRGYNFLKQARDHFKLLKQYD